MSNQLPLPGSSPITKRANQISKRASRQRRHLPVFQPDLIADDGFRSAAQAGVPRTRGECPTQRPCPHVRCRYHLFLEDADRRAGRPGLSSVPRDSRGLTLSTPGHAGNERPGTTLRPAWLTYRGLEVEREVKVYVDETAPGEYELVPLTEGALDLWLSRLHKDDKVVVWIDGFSDAMDDKFDRADISHSIVELVNEQIDKALEEGRGMPVMAWAHLADDGRLAFDRPLPWWVVKTTLYIKLTRIREVSSCALDLIDQHGKHSNEQVGDAIGRHRTLVARDVRRAMGKAIEVAGRMGVEREDLMRALMQMGSDR